MKNSKNKHRPGRKLALKLEKTCSRLNKKASDCSEKSSVSGLNKSIELMIIELHHSILTQCIEQYPWFDDFQEAGLAEVRFVEMFSDAISYAPRYFKVIKGPRKLHEKILLGKWLRYQRFYNQAFFTFREIGKPALGVSPPFGKTLQAA